VPGFESIIDQKRALRILTTFLQKGTIPHALLFTGIEGVGKHAAATAFAMACNCEDKSFERLGRIDNDIYNDNQKRDFIGPCGNCRSCRKIQSGNHPDVIFIKPSGAFIRIAQIRTLFETLALKPYEASWRVVIISNAQTLHPAAGNALLKMLEEPPDQTILILTAEQAADLLPTIVSRCQHIRFNPISRKNIAVLMTEEHRLDAESASLIAAMSNGSLSQALAMSESQWIKRRNWLIHASGLDQPATLSSRPHCLLLAFAEKLSDNKERLSESLEIMKTWLRDLVVTKYKPDKMINTDLKEEVKQVSQQIGVRSILKKIETIQTAQRDIRANANLRLTLELMMLRLAKD
jgi:DNA polymerase-3 subunit delta'